MSLYNKKEFLKKREKGKIGKKESAKEFSRFLSLLSTSTSVGFSISLPIVAGAIAGSYLDKIFGTGPKLTLLLVVVGLFLGLGSIYRIIKELNNNSK